MEFVFQLSGWLWKAHTKVQHLLMALGVSVSMIMIINSIYFQVSLFYLLYDSPATKTGKIVCVLEKMNGRALNAVSVSTVGWGGINSF